MSTKPLLEEYRRLRPSEACIICGHKGWCLIAKDGMSAMCQRAESSRRCKDAGWLHRLDDAPPVRLPLAMKPKPVVIEHEIDWEREAEQGRVHVNDECAERLGVSLESLRALYTGRSVNCLRFPMRDGNGKIIGIRIREWSGKKYAVTGSHNGVFVPLALMPENVSDSRPSIIAVCEGPTDTAALLSIGVMAIGLPSNTAGTEYAAALLNLWRPIRSIMLPDRDGIGTAAEKNTDRGIESLRRQVKRMSVARVPARFKDVRHWVQSGATAAAVMELCQ